MAGTAPTTVNQMCQNYAAFSAAGCRGAASGYTQPQAAAGVFILGLGFCFLCRLGSARARRMTCDPNIGGGGVINAARKCK